jgi:hypothetical protein
LPSHPIPFLDHLEVLVALSGIGVRWARRLSRTEG